MNLNCISADGDPDDRSQRRKDQKIDKVPVREKWRQRLNTSPIGSSDQDIVALIA